MFEYNARTEAIHGARFIEKDIILFDYSYTGDLLFQVDAVLEKSGFGFIIAEDDGDDIAKSSNIYLIKFSSNNSFSVIYKTGNDQMTLVQEYIASAINLYEDKNVIFFFRKTGEKLIVNRAFRDNNGQYQEVLLAEYRMPYDMERYKIGIYSNGGNTVTFASIATEAPTNWISNVFNANGGRIIWIRDGFIIDEAEYDIEVEAENIELKAGTYWFDYNTTNPDIKAYVYQSYRRDTREKRERDEIIETRMDEIKNILQKDEDGAMFFTLMQDHAINIKFKGKWGTVKNIAVKHDKYSNFVETDYNSVYRAPGHIIFDLQKINRIDVRAVIHSIPHQDLTDNSACYLFRCGNQTLRVSQQDVSEEEKLYSFSTESRQLQINGQDTAVFPSGDLLYAFHNVTADIYELIVTMKSGKKVNVLLQKTSKFIVNGQITSPIIVTSEDETPFDLSSSFRHSVKTDTSKELFHAYNPIHLQYVPDITHADTVMIYGILKNEAVYKEDGTITDHKTLISYTPSKEELLQRTITLPDPVKKLYKWIYIEYNAIQETTCIFSNWEREVYDLEHNKKVFLTKNPLDTEEKMIMYGIADKRTMNLDLLYYIPFDSAETSIDLCCSYYDIIPKDQYKVTDKGKVILNADVINQYQYLIIDYLKKDSYALNHKDDNWEVDISSNMEKYKIFYDSKDGKTTNQYTSLSFRKIAEENIVEEDDFIVLEANA